MPALRTCAKRRYTHNFAFAEVGRTGVARQNLVDRDLRENPTAGYGLMNIELRLSYRKLSAFCSVGHFVVEHAHWRVEMMVRVSERHITRDSRNLTIHTRL
jgi:hypothetical protein